MPQTARAASGQASLWVRALGRTLSGIVFLAALALAWFIYKVYYSNPRTDDAYVHANTASVAAHVSGQIIRLPINDNQGVEKGDLLFVVDSRPYKLALDTARTKLNLTEIENQDAARHDRFRRRSVVRAQGQHGECVTIPGSNRPATRARLRYRQRRGRSAQQISCGAGGCRDRGFRAAEGTRRAESWAT
jgi:multidrug resistance efflux pump